MRKNCPICGKSNPRMYMRGIYDCAKTSVMECCACGVQFLEPMMSLSEERKYYRDYYASQKDRYVLGVDMDEIQRKQYEYYLQYYGNYSKYLKKTRRFLEIGSGSGAFLKLARERFPDIRISCLERSAVNRRYLRKRIPGIKCYADQDRLGKSKFDLIVCFAVLEHQRSPIKFMTWVREHLTAGGCLIMEMPNKNEPLIELYGSKEFRRFNYQKQHYYTYSEVPLRIVAEKAGLRVKKLYYAQQYGFDNHISWMINKKPADYARYTGMFSARMLKGYKRLLVGAGITDVLGMVACGGV